VPLLDAGPKLFLEKLLRSSSVDRLITLATNKG